jgi:asparagine synthase (glutamine-hydrolysing)
MLSAAPHRGTGAEIAVLGSCAVGVSRDDDVGDAWVADEPDLAVALAGTVDDLDAVARDLKELGFPPASASPASVAAAAFRAWGETAPDRMRGPFVAAVTDGRRLWVARDQVGYRTAFYRIDARGAAVASEAKQVVAGAELSPEPDLDVLEHVFFLDYDDDTPAALRGVRRLPKSTLLEVGPDRARSRRTWHPDRLLESGRYDADEVAERFHELFSRAVDRALAGADAVALSGGIDSPAVAAYGAARHEERFGTPLAALTAVFPDQPSADETRYVELIASRFGMPLHTYDRHRSPLDKLQEWVRLFDGLVPVFLAPDAEVQYRVAADLGYRNVLGGFAAELVVDMRHSLVAHLIATGRWRAAADRIRGQLGRGVSPLVAARQAAAVLVPRAAYAMYRRWRPPRRGSRVPPWIDLRRVNARAIRTAVAPRHRWRESQLGGFAGPGLSVEAHEVVQEVCGVRCRRPWTDVDLWEFFLSLPADQKFPDVQTKGLVRRLLRGRVPDEVLDRRDKTVFNDSLAARIDLAELRRWLPGRGFRMPGVDYDLLERRLETGDMGVFEYLWAKDLASAHAFVGLWEGA